MNRPAQDTSASRLLHCALRLLLMPALLLAANPARATAGFAEYSWSFHDRPGQWIEWHHGDICPPGAPGKNCVFIRQSKSAAVPRDKRPSEPVPYADPPEHLYFNTVFGLLPPVLAGFGLARLWRCRGRGGSEPGGSLRGSTWAWGLATLLALAFVPHALRVLFPASPGVDGWWTVIVLSLDIAIVLAPFTLWWTYRKLFPPPGRARRKRWPQLLLWPGLLLSSLFAPHLLSGPPNLLLFLFPPAMLMNIIVSLLAVWAVSKAANVIFGRIARKKEGGTDTAP